MNFAVPIQNRTGRAQKTIADLALAQGEVELEDLELFVRTDVLSAWRDVNTAAKRIDSARVDSACSVIRKLFPVNLTVPSAVSASRVGGLRRSRKFQ